ncbi:MAG: hypothetical protein JMDDDDMK_00321 [Acidobacteria bacterium]|nr:hypothetical protein [Acidobacteriota bacterium]
MKAQMLPSLAQRKPDQRDDRFDGERLRLAGENRGHRLPLDVNQRMPVEQSGGDCVAIIQRVNRRFEPAANGGEVHFVRFIVLDEAPPPALDSVEHGVLQHGQPLNVFVLARIAQVNQRQTVAIVNEAEQFR